MVPIWVTETIRNSYLRILQRVFHFFLRQNDEVLICKIFIWFNRQINGIHYWNKWFRKVFSLPIFMEWKYSWIIFSEFYKKILFLVWYRKQVWFDEKKVRSVLTLILPKIYDLKKLFVGRWNRYIQINVGRQ